MKNLSAFFVLILLTALPALAQPELSRNRMGLAEIKAFYLNVDVEGPKTLVDDERVEPGMIQREIRRMLTDAGIKVIDPTEFISGDDGPYLYIHVNMMDAGRGLVPFAINAQFYQHVQLPHHRIRTLASTWDYGLVGIASMDQIAIIAEAAQNAVDPFIEDYQIANQ